MALLQAWKARVAARTRKQSLRRARGLAGTPVAVKPRADLDELGAPEGPFGRADVTLADVAPKRSGAESVSA